MVVVEINLVFWRGIEIDLVLMWVSKLIFLERGVEIDFVVVFGPTTFWFSCMDRNLLFVLVLGSRLTRFSVRAENELFLMWRLIGLFFVRVVEVDLIVVCGPKITWF